MKVSSIYSRVYLISVLSTIFVVLGASCSRPDVQALKAQGDIDSLVRILGWVEGEEAGEALIVIGSPAVEPLIAALKKNDEDMASRAAYVLGQIGDPRAIDPLIAAFDHNFHHVGQEAALALAEIGDPRAIDAILEKIHRIPEEIPKFNRGLGLENIDAGPYGHALGNFGIVAVEPLKTGVRNYANDRFVFDIIKAALTRILYDYVSPVCKGTVIKSTKYDQNDQGYHPIAISNEGKGFNDTATDLINTFPPYWILPVAKPESVEIVLCYTYKSQKVETCRYSDGTQISRNRITAKFTLRAAATGEEIDTLEIEGGGICLRALL